MYRLTHVAQCIVCAWCYCSSHNMKHKNERKKKNWWRKAIKLPFPVNKQHSTYTIFYVLNSFFPPLLSLHECQMHTDDDDINVHKILPTVSSKQRKNSEFGFAHMICVPCDVSLSLPYMSLNKYCLNEKVNSCGCTVLGCCCFFSLLSFNPNSSALLCVCRVCLCRWIGIATD